MVGIEIRVRFIDANREIKFISKSLENIEYVEQLVQGVLEDEGVKPVCWILFGLKLTNDKIWLAPSEPIKSFIAWSRNRNPNGEPKLEIRMRFRPSSLVRVYLLDSIAFDLIFAQINHDFMRTRFTDEKRDFVLLNDSVLGLVALNLILYSVERGICIEDILKQAKPVDFIPQRASRWQSALLFRLSKHINLQETLRLGFEQCASDTRRIKEKFLELFLLNVATDYNNEVYNVHQLKQNPESEKEDIKSELKQLRVRYNQSRENAMCSIETCTKIKHKDHVDKHDSDLEKWVEICHIETISQATLKRNHVQIVGPDGTPQRFQFETSWQAKSFLSCIDGYYRLMKKWNFNLCCEIFSPELRQLAELGCHGPIGLETTKLKLSEYKRPDCYLIRKCMENRHKFLIDTFVFDGVLLTIDVDWIPELRLFKLTGHSLSLKGLNVSVRTEQEGYSLLNNLIYDTEIRIKLDLKDDSSPIMRVHQLKYKIVPCGNDIYPALMLSMSPEKFKQLELENSLCNVQSTKELPRVFPRSSLRFLEHLQAVEANSLRVDLAIMDDGRQVVIKNHEEQTLRSLIYDYTFHHCPNGHSELGNLKLSQIRLTDWLFVKSDLFAETIGYMISGSLVQEYLPLGRLDTFLRDNQDTGQLVKLSASFQLAQALLFLDERQIIHGKIRCRNIMLKRIDPIRIKLTDPLGAIDIVRDQAFIPSEYFNSSIKMCVRKFHFGVDIWAAGTTIWQIFNQGIDPPTGRYANKLTQSKCPAKVWHLIEGCWMVERDFRTNPRMLHRDLFDLIAWERGSHHYFYISPPVSNDMIDNNYTPPTNTTASSTSDLSTLDNIDSILSSPNSTYSNDSKTGLVRARDSIDFGANQDHTDGATTSVSYLPTFRSKHTNWTVFKVMNQKRAAKRLSLSDLPPDSSSDRFSDIFGSHESLNSSSEITGSTRVMDSQSISDAFDRCIWHVDSRRLELGVEIGRGSSGIVIKGTMLRADGDEEVVAVKRLDRDCRDPNSVEDLKREFDILKNLNHKNIVKTFGYAGESQLMLIFEYMPLGSLLSCLRNLPAHEDLFKLPLRKYAFDIASGMEYLESKKIVHRDLALRNILLNDHHDAKICDFGLAQSLGANNFYRLETERALPLKWYAPETLSTWLFTHKSDVWSYGVVLWEIFSSGDSPQYSGTYANLSETLKHERLPMPVGCPRDMYVLMLACWAYDPNDRKTFEEIRILLE